jgi:hypothetical protein
MTATVALASSTDRKGRGQTKSRGLLVNRRTKNIPKRGRHIEHLGENATNIGRRQVDETGNQLDREFWSGSMGE